MEEMIARWIQETREAYRQAKLQNNFYKMIQMKRLNHALIKVRDNLLIL